MLEQNITSVRSTTATNIGLRSNEMSLKRKYIFSKK